MHGELVMDVDGVVVDGGGGGTGVVVMCRMIEARGELTHARLTDACQISA